MKNDFRAELEKLIAKHEDSILAKYVNDCLIQYDRSYNEAQLENPFGVDLNKMPEPINQAPQPIAANVGNKVTTGWSNPFGGTSWGL